MAACISTTATGRNCKGSEIEAVGYLAITDFDSDNYCVSQKGKFVVKGESDDTLEIVGSIEIDGQTWNVDSVLSGKNCCDKLVSHHISRVSIPCPKVITVGQTQLMREGCDEICAYVPTTEIEGQVFKSGFARVENGNDRYNAQRYRLYSNQLDEICDLEAQIVVECEGVAYDVIGLDLEADCPYATLRESKAERYES